MEVGSGVNYQIRYMAFFILDSIIVISAIFFSFWLKMMKFLKLFIVSLLLTIPAVVAAAQEAFEGWKNTSSVARGEILRVMADLLEQRLSGNTCRSRQ